MIEASAVMYVFAGNNGSGKSTFRNLIADRIGVSVNIDPDAIARGKNKDNPERYRISAGKESIQLARDCIRHHRDFSVETTLAGGNGIRLMQMAKVAGFEVTLFYLGLNDYHLNIERVAARVRNGGHDISTEDIIRRHTTSIRNLMSHLQVIDHLIVIDNSEAAGVIVLRVDHGRVVYEADVLPSWMRIIREYYSRNPAGS